MLCIRLVLPIANGPENMTIDLCPISEHTLSEGLYPCNNLSSCSMG